MYLLSITKLRNKLVLGDCLEVIKRLPDNSVDALITDPPYGISFMGRDWDKAIPPLEVWVESLRVLKAGCFAFIMSSPRQDVQYRMIQNLEIAGFIIGFTPIYWAYASGFPKAMNISKAIDKKLGLEREVIGYENPYMDGATRKRRGVKLSDDNIFKDSGYDIIPLENGKEAITKPASKRAQELDGSYGGFQPKPAVEVIIVAMKPLDEESYLEQAINTGKGITWLDNCRIPLSKEEPIKIIKKQSGGDKIFRQAGRHEDTLELKPSGRFSANLLVSNRILDDGREHKSSGGKPILNLKDDQYFGVKKKGSLSPVQYSDSGSFSRYFDLDLWFKERLVDLPPDVQKTFPFLVVSKSSKSERNKGLDNLSDKDKAFFKTAGGSGEPSSTSKTYPNGSPRPVTKMKNIHPTVKPIKLMSYLVILATRKGELVLDPYMGSGTTAIACKIHRRDYVGCDINKEWLQIALARLKAVKRSFDLSKLVKKGDKND